MSIAALTLLQHAFAFDLGIDQLLFSNSSPPPAPGRMSKPAATGFLLLGVSLLLLHAGRGLRVAQGIALLALLVSGFFCLGYLYRGPEFASFGPFGPIALPTALALFVLSLGTLAASPNTGLVGLLTGNRVSSRTARLLIPAVVLVPVVGSYARLEGQRAGWFDTEPGLALFTLVNIVALAALVWWSDSRIQRSKRRLRQAGESLRESEQRFQGVLEGVPHLVWTCRPDGSCDFLSRQWAVYTGGPEAIHLGSGWLEAVHPDDRGRMAASWQRAVTTQTPFDSEFRIRSGAGEYRWFRAQAVWVADGDGGKWFGTDTDIHDKKRAEEQVRELTAHLERRVAERTEALRESEERYRVFVDNATDAFFIHDDKGKILDANHRACESLGYTREELLAMTPLDFNPDLKVERLDEITVQLESGGLPVFEARHRRKDGSVFPVEVKLRPFTFRGEQCAISIARDLSERRALEADRRLADFAISRASVASYLVAPDARILRVNQATCEMLGYTEDELTRMTVHGIDTEFPPEVWPRHWAELRDKKHIRFESVSRHRDGRTIPVEIEINYLQFEDREYNFAFARDITERKRSEASLRASEERLRVALTAAAAIAFVWDAVSDSVVRYFSTVPSLPVNVNAPEPVAAVRDRVHPDDLGLFDAGVADCVEEGTEYRNLYRVVDPDGSIRWLQEWGTLSRDSAGRPLRLTGISIDVTDRKRVETALRESEERYRLAIRATNDAVWDIDVAKDAVHWSEKYTSAFGRPPETASSWQWWIDRIHPDDRDRTAGSLRAALDGTVEDWASEYRFQLLNGEWADIRDRAYIARDPAGKAVRVVGAMQDVTAFRRAAAERDRMWNLSLDPMCVAGFDGYFKQVNPAWEQTLGWTAEELTSRPWLDFVHVDDRGATVNIADELIGGQLVIVDPGNWTMGRTPLLGVSTVVRRGDANEQESAGAYACV